MLTNTHDVVVVLADRCLQLMVGEETRTSKKDGCESGWHWRDRHNTEGWQDRFVLAIHGTEDRPPYGPAMLPDNWKWQFAHDALEAIATGEESFYTDTEEAAWQQTHAWRRNDGGSAPVWDDISAEYEEVYFAVYGFLAAVDEDDVMEEGD